MSSLHPNRRLAAVLFADVAGYSRLMEQDESGTHVRVGVVFGEVVEPCIKRHAGRRINRTGDGILAEFPSATAALRCAIEIQRQAEERSRPVRLRDPIRFRIGINVADILVDERDIAGVGAGVCPVARASPARLHVFESGLGGRVHAGVVGWSPVRVAMEPVRGCGGRRKADCYRLAVPG